MKGELDIGFAELNLLPACGGTVMEESCADLRGELALCRRGADLRQELRIAIGEEAVLREAFVPPNALEIVERAALRQVDLAHGGGDVGESSQAGRLLLHEIFVASQSGCVIDSVGEERQGRLDTIPARRGGG